MSGTKIYVGNVPDSARRKELQDLFEKHGTVTECDIIRDFAFVHFDSPSAASEAVRALDGYEFLGQKLQVEISHSRGRGGPRGRGPPRDRGAFRNAPRYRSPPRYRDTGRDYFRRPPPRDYAYSSHYSPPPYRTLPSRDYPPVSSYRSRSPYGREGRYSPPRYSSDFDRYAPPPSRYSRMPPRY